MARCDQCGNEYDKIFHMRMSAPNDGKIWSFDSFECAIQALAPICAHCQCRILGHGVEEKGVIYCCAHCAGQRSSTQLRDRVE